MRPQVGLVGLAVALPKGPDERAGGVGRAPSLADHLAGLDGSPLESLHHRPHFRQSQRNRLVVRRYRWQLFEQPFELRLSGECLREEWRHEVPDLRAGR